MNKKIVFKGLALLNFILLIVVFLLYKNGTFDRHIPKGSDSVSSKPNTENPALILTDSLPQETDGEFRARMSSSKSIIVVEPTKLSSPKSRITIDTVKRKPTAAEYKLIETSKQ